MNLFWGLKWKAIPQNLTESCAVDRPDIVIGCVDSRAARRVIHLKVTGHQSDVSYYLDLGNHSTGGQFVLGQPWNWRNRRSAMRLRTAPEILPELIDPARDNDGQPSCSALEAIERQESFVNQTLANHALGMLARLFRYGAIDHHGAFVNLQSNRVQPLAIDPEIWKRLRRRGGRLIQQAA
jgi:PRTRC genetic system ThiF family protein